MLTVTTAAAQAIQAILDSDSAPDGAVFRISSQAPDGGEPGTGIMVSIADSAPAEDQVIDAGEVEVWLEPQAAEILDDKQLDATVSEGQVQFSLSGQSS